MLDKELLDYYLSRYRGSGVIVDSNLLILLFVGEWEPGRIDRFKPCEDLGLRVQDYHLLKNFLKNFARILTTPHLLAEANNLANKLGEREKKAFYLVMAEKISVLQESYNSSSLIAETAPCYSFYGLNDASIELQAMGNPESFALTGKGEYLVLTLDGRLAAHLSQNNIDAINFNNLRKF